MGRPDDSAPGTTAAARPFEPRREDKPWGYELLWALTDAYCGKVLHVDAGEELSLQYHERKDESLYVLRGVAEVTTTGPDGEQVVTRAEPGFAVRFPPGARHRLRAVEDCEVLEVSTPFLDDVVRLEDRYGR